MHHQTYGFQSFHSGDDIEIVNPETLLAEGTFKVKSAKMVSPREIEITLTKPVPANLLKNGTRVVENITWTPRVHIARCHFSRIPTRGILITTRQPSGLNRVRFTISSSATILSIVALVLLSGLIQKTARRLVLFTATSPSRTMYSLCVLRTTSLLFMIR